MDFDNIEVFLTVAQMKSMSKAAKVLFISQSTVSYRLKLLEEELGCRLIERGRGTNQSVLTKEGEAFFLIAERLKQLRYDIDFFKEFSSHPSIKVGSVESLGIYLFDELYNDLAERNRRMNICIFTNDNEVLYEMVERRQIDVAYVVDEKRYKEISVTPIFVEPMVLIASPDMHLKGKIVEPGELNIKDACQLEWKGVGIDKWYQHWFSSKDKPYMRTNCPPLAYNFLKNHVSWAIVPYSMGLHLEREEGMKMYELTESPEKRTCYRVTSTNNYQIYSETLNYWDREMARFIRSKSWLTFMQEK